MPQSNPMRWEWKCFNSVFLVLRTYINNNLWRLFKTIFWAGVTSERKKYFTGSNYFMKRIHFIVMIVIVSCGMLWKFIWPAMYAFRVEASLYRENCPKSAATVLLKKTYQALFVFWEINLSFFCLFHLEENTELLEAGHRWEGEPGHLLTEQDPLVSPWCNV